MEISAPFRLFGGPRDRGRTITKPPSSDHGGTGSTGRTRWRPLHAGNGALAVGRSHGLAGTPSDDTVEALAAEDGRARVFTSVWGPGNREPRAVEAVNRGAEVSSTLVSHELHGALVGAEQDVERLAPQVPLAEHLVLQAADDTELAYLEKDGVDEACSAHGLSVPDHHWLRVFGEVVALGVIGGVDAVFTMATFEVFNLSDQPIGPLPFNELQLGAVSTVVALLLLTRLAGHRIRTVGHLLEGPADGPEAPTPKALRVKRWFTGAAAVLAVSGVGGVLVGLSQVRASYLAQMGVDAHPLQFLLIQLGVAAAAVSLSWSMAHPFDQQYRAATRRVTRATAHLSRAYVTYTAMVGGFNGLLRFRDGLLNQHVDWSKATVTDARRKGLMYARRVLLAQPEPTTDALLPVDLPVPDTPELIAEVIKYRNGDESMFKRYEPFSVDVVKARLDEIEARRAERVKARAEAAKPSKTTRGRRGRVGGPGLGGKK